VSSAARSAVESECGTLFHSLSSALLPRAMTSGSRPLDVNTPATGTRPVSSTLSLGRSSAASWIPDSETGYEGSDQTHSALSDDARSSVASPTVILRRL
jgi:hypothetical protein